MNTKGLLTGLFFLNLFSTIFAIDNEDWRNAAKEVTELSYPKQSVDSILTANIGYSSPATPLRQIKKNRIFEAETLVYEISWGIVPVGFLELTATYDEKSGQIRLGGKGLSGSLVGMFYRTRDVASSVLDPSGLYPVFFEQHNREGQKYKKDSWIIFDHKNKVLYSNDRKSKRVDIPMFIQDFLSLTYYVRNMPVAPKDTFSLQVFVDNKIHTLAFTCGQQRKEKVSVGTFNCIPMVPRLVSANGKENNDGLMELWISNDRYRVPVIIRSKIKMGYVTGKLSVWKHGKSFPL